MISLYDEYASVEAKIKELDAQKDQLRGLILKQMMDNGQDAVETATGKFSITRLKIWTYPEKVLAIGEKFKAEKAKAESTGDATYVEKESLRFTGVKL